MSDGSVFDEAANKAIVHHAGATFSYTGLAILGKLRTDEWLVENLSLTSNMEDVSKDLADKLTAVIRPLPYTNKGLSVVVSFWAMNQAQEVHPWMMLISNQHKWPSGELLAKRLDHFCVFARSIPIAKLYTLIPTGVNVPSEIINPLVRTVGRALYTANRSGTHPSTELIGSMLARGIRDVARSSKYVGSNLMLTAIPKEPSQPMTFAYLRGSDEAGVSYLPAVVGPTGRMHGAIIWSGDHRDEWDKRYKERLARCSGQ